MTDNLMPPPVNVTINDDDDSNPADMDPLRAFQELKNKNMLNVNRNMYLMSHRVSFNTLVDQTNLKKLR